VPIALMVAVTLMVVFAPEARVGMVQGSAAQPEPLTLVMVRLVGVSVTWMLVAVHGPALAMKRVELTLWPTLNGPDVVSVLTSDRSAAEAAVPPLRVLSELSAMLGSSSAGVAVAALSNAPAALIVAVTLTVVLAPEARLAMVQGSAAQPEPLTLVIDRLV